MIEEGNKGATSVHNEVYNKGATSNHTEARTLRAQRYSKDERAGGVVSGDADDMSTPTHLALPTTTDQEPFLTCALESFITPPPAKRAAVRCCDRPALEEYTNINRN